MLVRLLPGMSLFLIGASLTGCSGWISYTAQNGHYIRYNGSVEAIDSRGHRTLRRFNWKNTQGFILVGPDGQPEDPIPCSEICLDGVINGKFTPEIAARLGYRPALPGEMGYDTASEAARLPADGVPAEGAPGEAAPLEGTPIEGAPVDVVPLEGDPASFFF